MVICAEKSQKTNKNLESIGNFSKVMQHYLNTYVYKTKSVYN